MIDYHLALAKYEALQRLSAETRRPVPEQFDADREILRQVAALRAITIHRFVMTAWARLRKALVRRSTTDGTASRDAIGS